MRCPLCNAAAQRRFVRYGYPIWGCLQCGHRFAELVETTAHVERLYDDAYFQGGTAGYADYLSEAALLRERGRRYARRLRSQLHPGRVLDVGCAAGFILQGFVDAGWQGVGVEPNARMAEYGRNQLGLPIVTGTLEELPAGEPFDLVVFVQVIAHFVNPRAALLRAAELTRPGGHWLIETWNPESLTAQAFGRYWHEYSPPSVLHWFPPRALLRLAAELGFRPVARGRPVKQLNGAHARLLLQQHLPRGILGRLGSALLGLVPDRAVLPYPAEDLYWMLFRKI